jgi:hypothetical protein
MRTVGAAITIRPTVGFFLVEGKPTAGRGEHRKCLAPRCGLRRARDWLDWLHYQADGIAVSRLRPPQSFRATLIPLGALQTEIGVLPLTDAGERGRPRCAFGKALD